MAWDHLCSLLPMISSAIPRQSGNYRIFVPDVSGAITFWWSVSLQNPCILLFLYYIGRFWVIFWRCQTFHSKDYRVGAQRLFSSYLEPLCPGCFSEGLSVPEKKSSNKNRCFHTPTLKSFWTEVICWCHLWDPRRQRHCIKTDFRSVHCRNLFSIDL